MGSDCTTHIPSGSTDKTTMSGSGDGEIVSAASEDDEANIRWLLAAVRHHQPEEEPPEGGA